jgi:ParB-like chromosome segregation protein Spo0J
MNAAYKQIQEKMGEGTELDVSKLTPSEFNTRHAFIDQDHVDYLTGRITERGFHPKRAIAVNVLKNAKGEIIAYRVVAGIHRFEAAKKAGLVNVPCLLYNGLTEDEECLLDKWDNEMDEDHKPFFFLDEAEHYRYLRDNKGWSIRQIAKNKNIGRSLAHNRLKIGDLQEEVKGVIRGVQHAGHFAERHFEEICKLKTKEAQQSICREIAARGIMADSGAKENGESPIQPMRQKEIGERVRGLLALEASGKEIKPGELPEIPAKKKGPVKELELEEHIIGLMNSSKRDKFSTSNMKFDLVPRWMKHAPIARAMSFTVWGTLRTLIEFCMRYHPKGYEKGENQYFYIAGLNGHPVDTYGILANAAGIKSAEKIEKRHLKELESRGYVEVEKARAPGYPRFMLNWDKIMEYYLRYAWAIPFREGGLKDLPEDFTGIIAPTPCHEVYITNGQIKSGIDYGTKDTYEWLMKEIGFNPHMAWKIINNHELGQVRKVLKEMEIHEAKYKKKGKAIKDKRAFFMAALKGEWDAV